MTLQASGTITMDQIQTEFGGSNPISLNEYYAGGSYVPSGTSGTNGAVPSSGTISISNFYGTQKAVPSFTFSITSNQDRANLRSLAVAAGWNQSAPVVATLNAGVYIYSTVVGTAALTIDGSFPGGVTLVNNGYIMGMGGKGGGATYNGSAYTYNYLQSAGSDAINLGISCTIQNNSYIGGGGGGGGASSSTFGVGSIAAGGGAGGGAGGDFNSNGTVTTGGAGGGIGSSGSNASANTVGGGGGRIMPGSNITQTATGGTPASSASSIGGGAGNTGSTSSSGSSTSGSMIYVSGLGGSGGGTGSAAAGYGYGNYKLAGGGGGGYGASGGASLSGNAGAAGGKCANLNGYTITWSATGTRYGAIA